MEKSWNLTSSSAEIELPKHSLEGQGAYLVCRTPDSAQADAATATILRPSAIQEHADAYSYEI